MSEITDAAHAVGDFAQRPIAEFDELPKTERQILDAECFHILLQLCHSASPAQRNEVLALLAPIVANAPDAFQASRVAMVCGILVEWGAEPGIALRAILERLGKLVTAASSIEGTVSAETEPRLFAESPDALKAWKGLTFMVLPAMTMLCLDAKARQAARQNEALVASIHALGARHREVRFLDRLFRLADGEELIVLHPAEIKGFRIRLEAIASNFHLFSLLQSVLVGDAASGLLAGPRPNRKVIATATGEMPHDRLITDAAVWHYANAMALQPDGTLMAEDRATWIQGERSPLEIPMIDGERVVLLGPPTAARHAWDSSFFSNLHDLLRSKVEVVEVLSAGETETRLRRICTLPR